MKMSMFHMYVASCVPDGGIYHYICKSGHCNCAGNNTCNTASRRNCNHSLTARSQRFPDPF